jgi:hypothetical protein
MIASMVAYANSLDLRRASGVRDSSVYHTNISLLARRCARPRWPAAASIGGCRTTSFVGAENHVIRI